MFTGIIKDVGKIVSIDASGDWRVLIATKLDLENIEIGASIACDGICLTVIEKNIGCFLVQVSSETIGKTTAFMWKTGTNLNLERALRMGDELGGHLLSGHVDGIARIVEKKPEGDSVRYKFLAPVGYEKFIAPKGSIALDGVSLTINEVEGSIFGVNIIPHTQSMTTLGNRNVGDNVNFEVDMIARYVGQMLSQRFAS